MHNSQNNETLVACCRLTYHNIPQTKADLHRTFSHNNAATSKHSGGVPSPAIFTNSYYGADNV